MGDEGAGRGAGLTCDPRQLDPRRTMRDFYEVHRRAHHSLRRRVHHQRLRRALLSASQSFDIAGQGSGLDEGQVANGYAPDHDDPRPHLAWDERGDLRHDCVRGDIAHAAPPSSSQAMKASP